MNKKNQEIVRGILNNCQICNKKYNFMNKQHICKRCLRSVCSQCTQQKQLIFERKQQKRKPHRLCKVCKSSVDFLDNYHRHYKLVYNTTCKVGKQWAVILSKQQITHPPQYQKPKKDKIKSRNDLWTSLTFSYRNFIGNIILQIDYYTPLQYIYDKCLYVNCSQFAILFFLVHCEQQLTLDLINMLLFKLQEDPPSKQTVYHNLGFLGCSSAQINSLKYFIQYKFSLFVKDFSLNHLPMQMSLFVVSGMMNQKKPKSSLQKCFSIFVFVARQIILKNGIDFQKIQLQCIQTLKSQDFQTNMRVLLNKQQLQEQTKTLRRQSISLQQNLNRMSLQRSNSTSEDNDLNNFNFRRSVTNNVQSVVDELQQFTKLKNENESLKQKISLHQQLNMRKQSAISIDTQKVELSELFLKIDSLSKDMTQDMDQIQRLNKQLLECLQL